MRRTTGGSRRGRRDDAREISGASRHEKETKKMPSRALLAPASDTAEDAHAPGFQS